MPETKVWREAEVLPQSGVKSVSAETISSSAIGAPSASAQICGMTVLEPCPMSTAPWNSANLPSGFRPSRIVDGLESEVLPQPYHMPATPTPRRSGPAAAPLKEAAAASASRQRGRSASRHALKPMPSAKTWPVTVASPASNALRMRNSSLSRPSRSASSSNSCSCATAACGTPNPRKAPEGTRCVCTARATAR